MTLRWNRSDTSALGPRDRYWVTDMAATVSRSGLSGPSARFQPTKSRVCTSALQHQMPPPSMRFTRQRWPQGDTTMVRPVCVRFTTPTTTPPSSSIQTGIGSRRTTAKPKLEVGHIQNEELTFGSIHETRESVSDARKQHRLW